MSSTISAGTTAGTAIAISGDTSGQLVLQTNGTTTAVTIDTSQNVGIGTSSPATKLHLLTPSATAVGLRAGNSASYAEFQVDASGNSQLIAPGGVQIFNTNGSERMRINSSGNVLIGTTAGTGSERTALWYSSNSGPGLNIRDTSAQNGNTFIQFNNGTTVGGSITSNGTTTMTYGSASDYRLKENLIPLIGALTKVAQLQPKSGNWKVDGSEFIGFIAHELQGVFPDIVVGEKDKTDADGNPVYQMVGAGSASIIATLTAALQELKAIIDTQAAQIAALNAKVGI